MVSALLGPLGLRRWCKFSEYSCFLLVVLCKYSAVLIVMNDRVQAVLCYQEVIPRPILSTCRCMLDTCIYGVLAA